MSDDDADDDIDVGVGIGMGAKCKDSCYKSNGKMKKSKCSQNKCSACSECPQPTPSPTPSPTPDPTPSPTPEPTPSPTPNPTPSPTPNPTPTPTPNPTPAPTPPVLRNYDVVSIQNVYDGGNSYLDTCAHTSCAGSTAYQVQTASSSNRDSGSGLWRIIRAGNGNGNGIVNSGDTVYVVNMYGGHTWLDSCGGASCTGGTQWNVVTNSGGSRGSTSQWQIGGSGGAITMGETVTFRNLYSGGNGYLDSCGGASCGGAKWNVYTNWNVRGSTSQWRLIAGR